MESDYINVAKPTNPKSTWALSSEGAKPVGEMSFTTKTLPVPYKLTLFREHSFIKDQDVVTLEFRFMGGVHQWKHLLDLEEVLAHGDFWAYTSTAQAFAKEAEIFAKHAFEDDMQLNVFKQRIKELFVNVMEQSKIGSGDNAAKALSIMTSAPKQPSVAEASKKLPGMKDPRGVFYPCYCASKGALWGIIQHLNDDHEEWSREKIADWLDELHDSGVINIEFQPWTDEPESATVDENAKHIGVEQMSDITPNMYGEPFTDEEIEGLLKKANAKDPWPEADADTVETEKKGPVLEGKVYVAPAGAALPEGWKDVGFTTDGITFGLDEVGDDKDSIKFKMKQHYEMGIKIEDPKDITKIMKGLSGT